MRVKPHIKGDKRWKRGTIVKKLDNRSYLVNQNGNLIRRNRSYLKLTKEEKVEEEEGAYDWMPKFDDKPAV